MIDMPRQDCPSSQLRFAMVNMIDLNRSRITEAQVSGNVCERLSRSGQPLSLPVKCFFNWVNGSEKTLPERRQHGSMAGIPDCTKQRRVELAYSRLSAASGSFPHHNCASPRAVNLNKSFFPTATGEVNKYKAAGRQS